MNRFASLNSRSRRSSGLKAEPASAGFTIVEMLIVLGVAGFILLIVFLAIPNLERNSRNNQRTQDVQTILGAVSHWELTNSGAVPTTPADNFLQYDAPKLTYYDPTTGITSTAYSTPTLAPSNPPDLDKVYVYNYLKCDATTLSGYTVQGAGYNDVVALYALEGGNGAPSARCEQL